MKIRKEGDKSSGICEDCDKIVTVTFKYGTFETDDGRKAENVLLGYCDECGRLMLLPAQSEADVDKKLKEHNGGEPS